MNVEWACSMASSTLRPLARTPSVCRSDTPSSPRTVVPKWCTLDGFAEEISQNDGLDIHTTEPLVTLLVRTENSVYRIIPLQAGDTRVLVQGGQFFPEPTEARFAGSSFGGSFLKMHWIGVGLRMEIYAAGQRIVTSQVRRIDVLRDTPVTTAH